MCVFGQAPDEAADTVNLSQKVSIVTPEEPEPPAAAEEDKTLPEWSEKVANGILTGEVRVQLSMHIGSILLPCLSILPDVE